MQSVLQLFCRSILRVPSILKAPDATTAAPMVRDVRGAHAACRPAGDCAKREGPADTAVLLGFQPERAKLIDRAIWAILAATGLSRAGTSIEYKPGYGTGSFLVIERRRTEGHVSSSPDR